MFLGAILDGVWLWVRVTCMMLCTTESELQLYEPVL